MFMEMFGVQKWIRYPMAGKLMWRFNDQKPETPDTIFLRLGVSEN